MLVSFDYARQLIANMSAAADAAAAASAAAPMPDVRAPPRGVKVGGVKLF